MCLLWNFGDFNWSSIVSEKKLHIMYVIHYIWYHIISTIHTKIQRSKISMYHSKVTVSITYCLKVTWLPFSPERSRDYFLTVTDPTLLTEGVWETGTFRAPPNFFSIKVKVNIWDEKISQQKIFVMLIYKDTAICLHF